MTIEGGSRSRKSHTTCTYSARSSIRTSPARYIRSSGVSRTTCRLWILTPWTGRPARASAVARLEVRQEAAGPVALLKDGDAAPYLLADRGPRQAAVGAEAAVVAVDTAADGHRPVHVRAGEPRVHGHAVDPGAEALAEEPAE